jgi:hypothetical protein
MGDHRGAPDLLHEAGTQRALDRAAGVVGAEAEEERRAGAVALQDLDEPGHAFARAAKGVDIDLEGELQGRNGEELRERS